MFKLNKFYIGESVQFMKENLPDDFVDLTVTSPPYDDLRKYKGFIFDYKPMLEELYRVTKKGGVVVWVVGDKTHKGSETLTSFKQAICAKETGFNIHDTMIYKKRSIPLNHNRYEQHFEYMFVFSKGKPKTFNPIMQDNKLRKSSKNEGYHNQPDGSKKKISAKRKEKSIVGNVWEYNVGFMNSTKDKIAYKHPAQFPEKLAEDHIISWSNEGDIVLDPMCGAGTTCKMAWLNNRKFIGIDISEEYINEICIPRLNIYGWNENNLNNTIKY